MIYNIVEDIEIPESMKKLPLGLQQVYQQLVYKCMNELPASQNEPNSDKKRPSLKLQIGEKIREIYVQFIPYADNFTVEIHVNIKDLKVIDNNNICQVCPTYKNHWSYFKIHEHGIMELQYYFELINQAYGAVKHKSKIIK